MPARSHPPSHIGQRANGWIMSMQMPNFKGVFERSSVGKAVGKRANGIPFSCFNAHPLPPIGEPKREKHVFFSEILTHSAISRVWRRGVCRAFYAIQVVFFGLPPMSCL